LGNDGESSNAVWPLAVMFSLLALVTPKGNRIGKPSRRQNPDEEHERNPRPIPLVISNSGATDSRAMREFPFAPPPWWKGLLEATFVMIAIGLLILNLVQSRATQQAANAARSTAEVAARQVELSQRPWISIDTLIVSPLTFTAGGAAQVTLKFAIRNVGSTPAKGLSIQPEMYIASRDNQDPVVERSKVCEANRTRETGADGILFPKGEFTKFVTFYGDAKDIVKESNRTGSFSPAVIVCANYRSTFDDHSRYTTGIIYYLRRIDPSHPGIYSRMKNGVEVPQELLAVIYDPIDAVAAN
jgi:hypothetical protein